MNGDGDEERDLPLLHLLQGTIGLIGLTGLLWWVSGLTAGPEHGGRYDVPSINGASWNLFLLSLLGAVVLTLASIAHLADRAESRRSRRSVGND